MLFAESDSSPRRAEVPVEGTLRGATQRARSRPSRHASHEPHRAAEVGEVWPPTSNEVGGSHVDGAHFDAVSSCAGLTVTDESVPFVDEPVPFAFDSKLTATPKSLVTSELAPNCEMPSMLWPFSSSLPTCLPEQYGTVRPVFGSLSSTTSTDSTSTGFSATSESHDLGFHLHQHHSTSGHTVSDTQINAINIDLGESVGSRSAMAGFDSLPAEIKIGVFAYLKLDDLIRSSRVSRSWNALAYDGVLWSQIDVRGFYSRIPKDRIEQLFVSAGEFLRTVYLRGCSQITSSTLRRMADACPNLAELDLEGCTAVSSRGLAQAVSCLHNLRKFHAAGLSAVTDDVLEQLAVATAGPKPCSLESLVVTRCRKVTAAGIVCVTKASPNLSTLMIGGCRDLDDATLEAIGSSCCAAQLRRLSLAWCVAVTDAGILKLLFPPTSAFALTDSEPAQLADRPKMSLTSLDLTGCVQVGDAGVSAVCLASPNLRFLDLEDCHRITDASLKALAENTPFLEVLSLAHCEGVRDEGISLVLAACSLRRLSLDCCPVTSATLQRIVELSRLCTAPGEEKPRMVMPPVASAINSMSPAGYDTGSVITSAPTTSFRLRELEVNDCIAVSSSSISEATSKFPSLHVRCFYTWQARAEEESRRTQAAASAANELGSPTSPEGEGEGGARRHHGARRRASGMCNIL